MFVIIEKVTANKFATAVTMIDTCSVMLQDLSRIDGSLSALLKTSAQQLDNHKDSLKPLLLRRIGFVPMTAKMDTMIILAAQLQQASKVQPQFASLVLKDSAQNVDGTS
jgi:hypothetical protein